MTPGERDELPESSDLLYTIARSEEEDLSRREAAIQKLSRLDESGEDELRALCEDGVSVTERHLAEELLSTEGEESNSESNDGVDELAEKMRRNDEQFREALKSDSEDILPSGESPNRD